MSTSSGRRATAPLARHGQLSSKNPVAFVLKLVAAALAVLLVSTASVAAVAVYNIASAIKPGIALPGEEEHGPQIGAIEGAVNLLLVGSDSGGGNEAYGERDAELNDVTMLLHISEDHTQATVVSFPRDLVIDIPACPNPETGGEYPPVYSQKLNAALQRGGLACPVLTIQELTGIEIPYAAKIEFDGVIAMSTAIGGVDVCVATPIRDRQISFELDAGMHTIEGFEALQFLRTRYGVGDGSDLTRISNQQQFLSSLVRKLKASETLSNPVKLYGIASAAVNNLEFSNSLNNVDTMVSIAGALKDIPLEDVVFVRYPGSTGMVSGQSVVVPNTEAADELFAAISADLPIEITGTSGGGTIADPSAPGPSDPASPDPGTTADPDATPEPGASPDPDATADPAAPEPSASAEPERIELPSVVEGQTAGQQTCTAGQAAGG